MKMNENQPELVFKELKSVISVFMKHHGYVRKSNNFYLKKFDNWGVVNIQRSKWNSKYEIKFTVNFGINSRALTQFYKPDDIEKCPQITDCHWSARIGNFMPEGDKWWTIKAGIDVKQLIDEVSASFLNIIMPEIDRRIEDKQLISLWMTSNQLNEMKNLAVLLKKYDMEDQLELTLNKIQARETSGMYELFKKWLNNS